MFTLWKLCALGNLLFLRVNSRHSCVGIYSHPVFRKLGVLIVMQLVQTCDFVATPASVEGELAVCIWPWCSFTSGI